MKILFVQVGGTIDKDYPEGINNHGYEFKIGEPAYLSIIRRVNPKFEYETETLLRKDSLDMTDDDRQLVRDFVVNSEYEQIIITHGTDTIHKTAEKLEGISDKTIVLTGAYLPEKFYNSDADFNLGMAVAISQTKEKGVFVVLDGLVEQGF